MIEEFINRLFNSKFTSLEVCPPCSPCLDGVVTDVTNSGILEYIDGIVVTDNPLAKMKHDSVLASIFFQNTLKKPTTPTISMRDRNIISLQSTLLGANNFDVRTILALTGDSIRLGDHKDAKSVYEGTSALMVKMINKLNENRTLSDKEVKGEVKRIYAFNVSNSYAKKMQNIKRTMKRKLSNNSKAIFTQPVYDIENAKLVVELFNEAKDELNIKEAALVLGYYPITSFGTAKFLHQKLPGLYVPQNWIDKMEQASLKSKDEEFKVGFNMSKELYKNLNQIHNKFHIMCSNKYDLITKIIKEC